MLYDRTLIQIRERSFLDLLDLSLHVIRARPLRIGLTALAGIAPWAVLNGWLLALGGLPKIGWIVLLYLEVPWATAPLTLVLGDLMFGRPVRVRRIVRTLLVSLPAMIVCQLFLRGILLVVCRGDAVAVSVSERGDPARAEPVRRERKGISNKSSGRDRSRPGSREISSCAGSASSFSVRPSRSAS